jgi:hypothetical protein
MTEPGRITTDLVQRVRSAAEAFAVRILELMTELPGNPRGLVIERFGDVVAPACPSWSELDFLNRVAGLTPANPNRLPEVLAFYRHHGVRPWFELVPEPGVEGLMEALADAGAAQVGFHAAFHGPAGPLAERARATAVGDVTVRAAEPGDAAAFGAVFARGHEVPEDDRDRVASEVATWVAEPGWRSYLAEVDGRPAGVAVLTAADGVGFLANAATDPSARDRGCQSALIRRRILDAGAGGCDLIAALAPFGSGSARNLERAGLRLTHLIATWRLRAGR